LIVIVNCARTSGIALIEVIEVFAATGLPGRWTTGFTTSRG
jgi:hypothetical protein